MSCGYVCVCAYVFHCEWDPFNSISANFCVYVAFALTFHCEWAIRVGEKGDWDFLNSELVKNADGTDI